MFFNGPQKEMVERPEKDYKFNKNNKVDRMILRYVLIGLFVVACLIVVFVCLYYFL